MNISRRISGILCGMITLCCASVAKAQYFETPPPEIVSAWKLNGVNFVMVFGYDGTFYVVDAEDGNHGMERGTFEWDKTTGAFSANVIVDTDGDAGLSADGGAATTISITGNTLNYTVAGDGTYTFTRVANTASAIVGSWIEPGNKASVTFLADGTYYHAQEFNDVPFGYTGMEKGTYTWNSTTKAFTATATIDTNGDIGFDGTTSGVTMNITGNTLVITQGVESFTLTRITTNPTPLRLPDFGTVRSVTYWQDSNAAPALAPADPYAAEAFVDPAVGATAPTVKIGAGTPIAIDADPFDPGSFFIEEVFPNLAGLNALLPASTAIQFKNGTGTANLTTGASLTFPSIPKINVGTGASWSSGVYQFGENEVLQWTLPTGFVASQYLTVVNITDLVTFQEVVGAELHGEVTYLDLSGKLEPGKQYEVDLQFYRIDSSTTAGSGVFSGKQGYTLSASKTIFTFESLPDTAQPPSITEQPVAQPVTPGSPLRLLVGINAEAFPTATFQWFKNNQAIPGQTGNSLFIPSFDLANDSGSYAVVVTNNKGSTTSSIANVGSFVEYLVINNHKMFRQVSTAIGAPSGGKFDARVEGVGITNTFPASAITVTKPNNTTLPLALDGDHWDIETDFPSFADMRAAFPTGLYKINIGSDSIPITLTGNAFPNQPLVTSSVGKWVNGKLQLTATQAAAAFTLTSNSNTAGVGGYSIISITDPADDGIFDNSGILNAEIPAGLLTVGNSYEVEWVFGKQTQQIDLSSKSWASPGASGVERLGMATFLTIEVVPDPVGTPYTTWQAGFFTPTQLGNPAISGDDVDFDMDGIDNLLEFILGTSPTTPNPNILKNATTTPATVGRNLVFFYDRKTAANGITQVIETSTSLTGTWTPAVHGVNGVVISISTLDGTTERVTATIPSTETKLFVHLKASR